MEEKDVVIIGGGPAGLAAAGGLYARGIRGVCILEQEPYPGGTLRQCIHKGFGFTQFKKALSGPEYIRKLESRSGISCKTEATVTAVSSDNVITVVTPCGLSYIHTKVLILASGCRERTRGTLQIPGERPEGIFTAGAVQACMNLYNRKIGDTIIIAGSADIGFNLIRLLQGKKIQAVYERRPFLSARPNTVSRCREKFRVPLYLSHTIIDIKGGSRIRGITVCKTDRQGCTLPGTEQDIPCDTLVINEGLIPETGIFRGVGIRLDSSTKGPVVDEYYQTEKKGWFAAGNTLYIHDSVDDITAEADLAAESAAQYVTAGFLPGCTIPVICDSPDGYVVPQKISGTRDVILSVRTGEPVDEAVIRVVQDNRVLAEKKLAHTVPSEMIRIPVPAYLIQRTGPLTVTFS